MLEAEEILSYRLDILVWIFLAKQFDGLDWMILELRFGRPLLKNHKKN